MALFLRISNYFAIMDKHKKVESHSRVTYCEVHSQATLYCDWLKVRIWTVGAPVLSKNLHGLGFGLNSSEGQIFATIMFSYMQEFAYNLHTAHK